MLGELFWLSMPEMLAIRKTKFLLRIFKLDDSRLVKRVLKNLTLNIQYGVKQSLIAARVTGEHLHVNVLEENAEIMKVVSEIRRSTQTLWIKQVSKKENQKLFVFYRLKPTS